MPNHTFYLIMLVLVSSATSVCTRSHTKENNPCGDDIPCDNYSCIPREMWCDGLTDCFDESDEKYCKKKTWLTYPDNNCSDEIHFTCNNKMCIPIALKCDGIDDCKDNSDEKKCGDPVFSGNFDSSEDFDSRTTKSSYTETILYSVDVDTETVTDFEDITTVADWADFMNTKNPPTSSLPENPSIHPISGLFRSTDKSSHENEPPRLRFNAGPLKQPGFSSFSTRESPIPISNIPVYSGNPFALPRNYLDISINFGRRRQAQDDPIPSQNQRMGTVHDCLKHKSYLNPFEHRNEADRPYQNVRKSDEIRSPRRASPSQSEDTPRSLVALFLLADSSPINIRVNG